MVRTLVFKVPNLLGFLKIGQRLLTNRILFRLIWQKRFRLAARLVLLTLLPFRIFKFHQLAWYLKRIQTHSPQFFNLSYPKSGSSSIIYGISKDDFSLQYVTIDDAIQGIKRLGPGCFLAKTDIKSAFRLIPIHPSDYELLGIYWVGKCYYDRVLPFGLRSVPSIFNQLSDALEWILINKCNITFACHILDDFLLIEPPA